MFSSLKIGLVLVMLAGAGGGYLYINKLQKDNATLKENQLKLDNYIKEIKAHRSFYQENNFPNLGSLFATRNIYKDLSKNSIILYSAFLICESNSKIISVLSGDISEPMYFNSLG